MDRHKERKLGPHDKDVRWINISASRVVPLGFGTVYHRLITTRRMYRQTAVVVIISTEP